MNKILSLLALFALAVTSPAAPPVVSNVTASQRSGTKLVDIYYDLSDADGDAQLIQMQVSADGGLTYTIPCVTLSGNIGSGVTPGSSKHIVWNAGADWNGQFVPSTKVRVTANDGTTPPPPPGMVFIPAGTFQMGDSFNEAGSDELPVHQVYVSGFFMERFEVSRELWLDVQTWANSNGYGLPVGSYRTNGTPVIVAWRFAALWCNARSEKEGLTAVYCTDATLTTVARDINSQPGNSIVRWDANGYRLPTEAEWEKAARGGMLGLRYPWGNTIDGSQANYSGSGDPFEGFAYKTTPLGYYNGSQTPSGIDMANSYGLYDMAGNVAEWCWDGYSSNFYGDVSANNDPRGPVTGGQDRVSRGGGYDVAITNLRNSRRTSLNWATNYAGVGLRCVRRGQ